MKKKNISFILVICLLVCMFSSTAFAVEGNTDTVNKSYYKNYTAIGDSICAGFAQADYDYHEGFDITKNISNSPNFCYARLVGKALGSEVNNLGKPGCDTNELLDILTNKNNKYYDVYQNYIKKSDLITLEIGSNDLLMATMHTIISCVGGDFSKMSTQEVMALAEPLLTGNIAGIVDTFKKVEGINLTPEQILAIQACLSDKALSDTLAKAYESYCNNYPKVVEDIRAINPNAKFVILNYYNPNKDMNFSWGNINYNVGKVIQGFTDKMNKFALDICNTKGYVYVDITDTQTNVVDPHPSVAGHAQIANHIINALLNTVTATALSGGKITPAGENVVKNGDAITFSIAANKYYEIGDVLVDGKSVGAVNNFTFTDVKAHHCITAIFKIATSKVHFNTYSAFGDSITAGFALCDYTGDFSNPEDCYVSDAARALGVVNNYNLALKAYTTKDLLAALTDPTNKYYTRFRSNIQASNLITVDIGSNDLTMTMFDMFFKCLGKDTSNMTAEERYEIIQPLLNGVSLESLVKNPEEFFGKNVTEDQKNAILDMLKTENIDASFAKAYDKFTKNWEAIIAAIREIKPDATIAAIGYYNSNPDLNFQCSGTTYNLGKVFQKYIDMMNDYISKKSEQADKYVYVDTTGIELNSTCNPLTFDPHPSKAGHLEIAARLVFALNNTKNPSKSVISVSLNKTTDALTVGGTDTLIATITPEDATNKNVTWSSNNPSVATVDSTGKITAISVGTAEIKVTTEDGNKTATCSVNVTAPVVNPTTVNVISVSLNKTTDSLTVGGTDTLIATINPSNATNKNVTWSSSNPSVATVDSTGKITAVSAGAAEIKVTTEDGNKTATCSLTVTNAVVNPTTVNVSSVSLNKTTDTLTVGGTDTLIATINPSNATNKNVTWSSSNLSVATVDSNGKITAVSAGTTEIKVTTEDGNKTATCNLTVTNAVVNGNNTATSNGTNAAALPKTGYMLDSETLALAGIIILLAGIVTILFRKKEC